MVCVDTDIHQYYNCYIYTLWLARYNAYNSLCMLSFHFMKIT